MHRTIAVLALVAFVLAASSAPAEPGPHHHGHSQHHGHSNRPDSYAPIGVMGEHMHPAGGWMLSYRFAYMRMNGNRDGTRRLSKREVLQDFMVTPSDMDVYMHMFSVMAAPTDWLTAMVMLPWIQKSMDHQTGTGTRFTTTSNNIGDVKTTGLFRLYEDEMHHLHLNFGMSWPTGQIRVKDQTPAGRATLPFPM